MSRPAPALLLVFAFAAARLAHGASVEAQVRDAAGKPVGDAVVYAMPSTGALDARPGRTHTIEQADREFVPYVSVVQTGTAVAFPNRDPILHHVYSFSAPKPFEIKLYSGKSPTAILFDQPGVVALGCNIHDWMLGFIFVVSTPYFAKTDASGNVRLRDVPAGSYELHVWHPQQRAAAAPRRLALEATSRPSVEFRVDPVPRKPKFKPPLDRMKYLRSAYAASRSRFFRNASEKSPTEWKRSAGSLASAFWITQSSCGGMRGLMSDGLGARSWRMRRRMSAPWPLKGRSPVRSS
jgi:plastocyanin